MYVYFGYFTPGHSIYALVSKTELPLERFKFKKSQKYDGTEALNIPIFKANSGESFKVYNLKTGNNWWYKSITRYNNHVAKSFTLTDPETTLYCQEAEDFLDEHECEIKGVYNDHDIKRKFEVRDKVEHKEETVDYPDLIIGNNIPKIKLDKEFNYVGKINFQSFPKRNHGDVGQ